VRDLVSPMKGIFLQSGASPNYAGQIKYTTHTYRTRQKWGTSCMENTTRLVRKWQLVSVPNKQNTARCDRWWPVARQIVRLFPILYVFLRQSEFSLTSTSKCDHVIDQIYCLYSCSCSKYSWNVTLFGDKQHLINRSIIIWYLFSRQLWINVVRSWIFGLHKMILDCSFICTFLVSILHFVLLVNFESG
jgi:hypothetical protein